ncbi:MAG: GNAT family N-acetyltransferase, partial [Gammaproteobacteria bacterium]|nr:GNAT family N-acetyltransferase [Gammaproteobacteria bacterium]
LPQYCGRGIGSGLLGNIMHEAASAGLPVTIHVEKFNPALRLYGRLGFNVIEDKGVYFLMQYAADRSTSGHGGR